MKKHVLAVVAYLVATFATQALSHFVVNVEHYAAVTFMRAEPIFALGVASMVIQGTIFSYLYSRMSAQRRSIGHSVGFSWARRRRARQLYRVGRAGEVSRSERRFLDDSRVACR